MTQHLIKKGVFQNDPLCLVDVGASGGIATYWDIFQPYLTAFGFEPLLDECHRLNSAKVGNVHYYPYFVGADNEEVVAKSGAAYSGRLFSRTSAWKASQMKNINYIDQFFNQGNTASYTEQKISIDQFFDQNRVDTVDFIKIDTDGYDYEVLYGAQKTLCEKQVMGVTVESQFYGQSHPHSNIFRNIDRLLTDLGYRLFNLDVYRYTKADLPGEFFYSLPAQTKTGQALWGEALYFRDIVGDRESAKLSPNKLLKLACLYELFDLPDCAAELLNNFRSDLAHLIDVDRCLDLLVKSSGKKESYLEHIKKFEADFECFYPSLQSKGLQKMTKILKLNFSSKRQFLLIWMRKFLNKNIRCRVKKRVAQWLAKKFPPSQKLQPMSTWERFYGGGQTILERARGSAYHSLQKPQVIRWLEGLKFKVYPNNDIGQVLFISGVYEPNSLLVMKRLLKKGSVFLDIGANAGLFTLAASRWVGPQGSVIAFEPSSREFFTLTENISLNQLSNVKVEPIAISNTSGVGALKIAVGQHNGQNTLCQEFAYEGVCSGVTEQVVLKTLDQYVEEQQISAIDLIKLDIEGAEYSAFQGGQKTLRTLRPALIFEIVRSSLKKNQIDIEEIENLLVDLKYQTYAIDETTACLIPQRLKEIKDGNAVALPINF